MKVLGLDMSTKVGFAIVDSETGLSAHGTHILDASTPLEYNVLIPEYKQIYQATRIAEWISGFVKKHEPDLILIEQTNAGAFRSSQKQLEFIHYAVLSALKAINCEFKVQYIDTSAWRSILGIKLNKDQRDHNKAVKAKTAGGKVTPKHLAVQWVNQKYNLSLLLKDNDAADAICIATAGAQKHSQKIKTNLDLKSAFSS